jgi:GntR family transcriptional regulator, rspAB operon transcriptional repressor
MPMSTDKDAGRRPFGRGAAPTGAAWQRGPMLVGDVRSAYEAIKQKILDGGYAPGQPLGEMALAQAHQIKRTRVRQILIMLEHDQLVEKLPAKGTFVKPITPELLQTVFEVREALEPMAARLAARRRDDAELQAIAALFDAQDRAADADSLTRKEEISALLHRFIRTSARNDMICSCLRVVELQTRRVWQAGLNIEGRINQAFEDHKKLLQHLKNQDERAAEQLMREHLVEASSAYFSSMFSR